MRIAGKVYLWSTPDGESVKLAVRNEGEATLAVTSNYFPTRNSRGVQDYGHDDTAYGHGLECMPGTWSWQAFPLGGKYNAQTIRAGGVFRIGLRAAAWKLADIPQPGEPPVVMDLARDFDWYDGQRPDTAPKHEWQAKFLEQPAMRAYEVDSMHKNTSEPECLRELLAEFASPVSDARDEVRGRVIVSPEFDASRVLTNWTVRFENDGTTPFVGTVAFVEAAKNSGIGLESMGLPGPGCAAEQRIENGGDYGCEAVPYREVRLGIRGYGHVAIRLPKLAAIEVPLTRFKRETSQGNRAFFDLEEVKNKRREKLAKVSFFEHGRLINEELEPISYQGSAALARAPFDPPGLSMERVGERHGVPRGWFISLEHHLPECDREGPLAFVATAAVIRDGVRFELPPKRFSGRMRGDHWMVPEELDAGRRIQEGDVVAISTGPLGWSSELTLSEIDAYAEATSCLWRWRPDQYRRQDLSR